MQDKLKISTNRIPPYVIKTLVSVFAGLLCFFLSVFSPAIILPELTINIIWSAIFPVMIALIWGTRYALIALILGIGAFYPFLIWSEYGFFLVPFVINNLIWITLQGYAADKRHSSTKRIYNPYIIQCIYMPLSFLFLFFSCWVLVQYTYSSWNIDINNSLYMHIFTIICFKTILNDFLVLAIADVILLLPFVRKAFRLPYGNHSRFNGIVIGSIVGIGVLVNMSLVLINYYILHSDLPMTGSTEINKIGFIVIQLVFFLGAGIAARIFQQKLSVENGLRYSELKYRNVFENIDDLYLETGLDGEIFNISPSVKDIIGYDTDEVIGKNIAYFYMEIQQRKEMLALLAEKGSLGNYQIQLRHRSGKPRDILIHTRLVQNHPLKKKEVIVTICRDVTDYLEKQRALLKTEKMYQNLFDKMLNGYFVMHPEWENDAVINDFIFDNVNPGFVHNTGLMEVDVLGKCYTDVFGSIPEYLNIFISTYMDGLPKVFETYSGRVDRYFLVNAFKTDDDRIGVIFQNITDYKNALAELNTMNNDLERIVDERTEKLQSAMSELEAFTYTVSHDLKSPLRAIDAYGQLVQEDYGEVLREDGKQMLVNMRTVCTNMISMIERLLQYSIANRKDIVAEQINIKDIFTEVFRQLKYGNNDREIVLLLPQESTPVIMADKILIKQVALNLISNAIKFTSRKKTAVIELRYRLDGDRHIYCLIDNGVGFDAKYSHKLFGIFQRLHSEKDFEGTGVGLASVQKIIERHGGKTWIEGAVDKGVSVYFSFPVVKEWE